MRRSVFIFLAAIFLPSLVLAWLAIRSVQDQQVVLEHQQVIISQNITDALAKSVQARMDAMRSDFVGTVQQLLGQSPSPQALAQTFDGSLRRAWPMAEIGFAVNLNGAIYSPTPYDGPAARTFRDENDRFLSNRENAPVYFSKLNSMTQNEVPVKKTVGAQQYDFATATSLQAQMSTDDYKNTNSMAGSLRDKSTDSLVTEKEQNAVLAGKQVETLDYLHKAEPVTKSAATPSAAADAPTSSAQSGSSTLNASTSADGSAASVSQEHAMESVTTTTTTSTPLPGGAPASNAARAPMEQTLSTGNANNSSSSMDLASMTQMTRNVIPQRSAVNQSVSLSNSVPEDSDFRRVIGSDTSGELARFLENKLRLLVWSHPQAETPIVFGAQLDLAKVIGDMKEMFQILEVRAPSATDSSGEGYVPQYFLAILDDTGHPVALSDEGLKADWKHPFVATEIGDVLPHWEAALYLTDPHQFSHAARTLQLTLALIVFVLIAAIVSGGSLIAADVRRQVRLAQQKTDFVSNVSHELKTPLTSIRMFADLLAEKRVPDEERQATYLRIISAEAARLTRLINNVLDFARLEKGKPPGEHRDCDLVDAVRDVVETCGPHLEAAGIAFHLEIETEKQPIHGDRDALAQIILNLVSNAEKYGGNDVLVRVRRQETSSGALGCVDVLDRGAGIPANQVKTVFEPFHRLDDSLANGIPGSGLGLTLSRRMARSHGGDVTYSARAGGGSCFTLTVPLA